MFRGSTKVGQPHILIATPIVAIFCEQTGSQAKTSSWQALKQLMIHMGQKKSLDLLVILSDLLDQRQQLTQQYQHQARLGTSEHCISLQMRLMQPFNDLRCRGFGSRMPRAFTDICMEN
jgi:hypothetical protein